MHRRDPLTAMRVLMGAWLLVVATVALLAFRDSPGAVADAVRRAPDEAVRIGPASTLADGAGLTFVVDSGMSADAIIEGLARASVVDDAARFSVLLALTGVAPELRAGCYRFDRALPASEVIRRLRAGLTFDELLAIPEGLRNQQVGDLLADAGIADRQEWEQALAAERARAAEEGRPEGVSLLGYLLPASYPVTCNGDAEVFLASMREAFTRQVDEELEQGAAAVGLTPHQVLTLASIVQREAVLVEEQPLIASVFLNRLDDGMALQADPTVQFAITTPESVAQYGWWKTGLTLDDLAFDSPYNTYAYPGLPPGPIANPGADAIRAVLRPATSDFLYFVARGDGSHAFALTLDEHNANVALYLGQ